jgi:hypothetical protein
MRRLGPVWTLLFLAPLIGEVLFGATPLSRLPAVLLQVGLYGGAAVLIRELVVRRNLRQWWLVALGLAYGIFEEGLVLQSLFNAHFRGLDVLGSYGRAAGVNWIWAMFIVPYHAVFSIAIPIVFTELLFPEWRGKPWLGKRGLWSVAAFLAINAVFLAAMIAHVFTASDLPWPQLILDAGVVGSIIIVAVRAPPARSIEPTTSSRRSATPLRMRIIGLLGGLAWFVGIRILLVGDGHQTPAFVPLAASVLLAAFVWWRIAHWSAVGRTWTPEHLYALAAGALPTSWLMGFLIAAVGGVLFIDVPGQIVFGVLMFIALRKLHVYVSGTPGIPFRGSISEISPLMRSVT